MSGRYDVDEEWDRAEAEMLEQINALTGEPTVRLTSTRAALPPPESDSSGVSGG